MKITGLTNLGNTCYLNSTIQALYCNNDLCNNIINLNDKNQNFISELFIKMQSCPQGASIDPRKFLKNIKKELGTSLDIHAQNDVHEFLSLFLDYIIVTFNSDETKQFISGTFIHSIKCDKCSSIESNYEPFTNIMISIPKSLDMVHLGFLIQKEFKETSIKDRHCDSCKCRNNGIKTINIEKTPKTFIFMLKRYSYNSEKIRTPIIVPNYIDITKKIKNSVKTVLELYAIICHIGSFNSGHYFVLCKHYETNKWFIIDDCVTKEIEDFDKIDSKLFYVLFYTTRINI